MEKVLKFEDLIAWQKAHKPVLNIYSLSKSFPTSELYGLTLQLRRAALSVPANIAEGFKRIGASDKIRFYNIVQGSLEETKYLLILSKDLKYTETHSQLSQVDEIGRLRNGLIKSIKSKT